MARGQGSACDGCSPHPQWRLRLLCWGPLQLKRCWRCWGGQLVCPEGCSQTQPVWGVSGWVACTRCLCGLQTPAGRGHNLVRCTAVLVRLLLWLGQARHAHPQALSITRFWCFRHHKWVWQRLQQASCQVHGQHALGHLQARAHLEQSHVLMLAGSNNALQHVGCTQ